MSKLWEVYNPSLSPKEQERIISSLYAKDKLDTRVDPGLFPLLWTSYGLYKTYLGSRGYRYLKPFIKLAVSNLLLLYLASYYKERRYTWKEFETYLSFIASQLSDELIMLLKDRVGGDVLEDEIFSRSLEKGIVPSAYSGRLDKRYAKAWLERYGDNPEVIFQLPFEDLDKFYNKNTIARQEFYRRLEEKRELLPYRVLVRIFKEGITIDRNLLLKSLQALSNDNLFDLWDESDDVKTEIIKRVVEGKLSFRNLDDDPLILRELYERLIKEGYISTLVNIFQSFLMNRYSESTHIAKVIVEILDIAGLDLIYDLWSKHEDPMYISKALPFSSDILEYLVKKDIEILPYVYYAIVDASQEDLVNIILTSSTYIDWTQIISMLRGSRASAVLGLVTEIFDQQV